MAVFKGSDSSNDANFIVSSGRTVSSKLEKYSFQICREYAGCPLNRLDRKLCAGIKEKESRLFLETRQETK